MRLPTSARRAICTLFVAVVPAAPTPAADRGNPRRDETVAVVERVKGAVVNIHSERTVGGQPDDPFRVGVQPQRVNGMGTGIVLDPRGYIVTNFHVIDDVQSLRVRLVDGSTCPARVIAGEKECDLAVIKIDPPHPLQTVPLGTAQDLMLAESVLAIGNAYGYEHTVTVGRVSALKRDVTLNKEVSYRSLIQTQTPINPGNSGGPLFNKLGEVVGVNVAIRAGAQNIAFAIPVDTMIAKAADMMSVRKRLGLKHGLAVTDRFARETEDGPVRRWVTVSRVDADSPAAAAGFRAGDVIDQVGELPVHTSIDLERALFDRPPAGVAVKLRRGGETVSVSTTGGDPVEVTLALAPAGPATPADAIQRRLGMKLYPVGAEAVARADRQLRGGLFVQEVGVGSAAAKAGLQRGDILIGLHTWEAISLDNVTYVLAQKELPAITPLKGYFVRDGRIRETLLTPAD